MGRKILNRKGLRADYDAAERRKQDEEEVEETEEEEEEADEEEEKEVDEEEGEEKEKEKEKEKVKEDEDEEEAPKKRKAAVKPAKPAKAKSRSRTPKIVRMKVVWGVFNNSNQRVATFDYPKRKDANDLADKLTTDKKVTHFVQPVKEPMEEKKEKEKS